MNSLGKCSGLRHFALPLTVFAHEWAPHAVRRVRAPEAVADNHNTIATPKGAEGLGGSGGRTV